MSNFHNVLFAIPVLSDYSQENTEEYRWNIDKLNLSNKSAYSKSSQNNRLTFLCHETLFITIYKIFLVDLDLILPFEPR